MKKRLLNALYAVPLMIVCLLYLPTSAGLAALIVIVALGQLEFYRLLDMAQIPSFRYVGTILGSILLLTTYFEVRYTNADGYPSTNSSAGEWDLYALVFAVLLLMIRQFPQKNNDKPLATIACTLLGVFYVAFPMTFFVRLGLSWEDLAWNECMKGHGAFHMVFFPILVAKMTDGGALFVGSAIGKHKLFPRVSPSKTWEGLIGGLVTGTLTAIIYVAAFHGKFGMIVIEPYVAMAAGLLLAIVGMVGDLAESLLKRAAQVKDSGMFIPGIGGTLDVIDSLIFAVPVLYVFAKLVF